MYLAFALISGVVLSLLISVNGNLSVWYGAFPAAAIIHLVGSLTALLLCALQKEKKPLFTHGPKWIYLGGAVGVSTTLLQNYAFSRSSVTSIVALVLLGQTVASLVVDRYGLFGMRPQNAQKQSWLGIALSLAGIFVMLDSTVASAILAVCAAFASGVTAVISRTINARLAEKTGALRGSLINHLVGLPITVALALFAIKGAATPMPVAACPPWCYVGGALGVLLVLLNNLAVPKVSAFYMTLLSFVGQIFTGILLDVLFGGGYTGASFLGGVFVAAGVAVHMLSGYFSAKREQKRLAYYARIRRIETAYRDAILEKQRIRMLNGKIPQ